MKEELKEELELMFFVTIPALLIMSIYAIIVVILCINFGKLIGISCGLLLIYYFVFAINKFTDFMTNKILTKYKKEV